MTKIKRGEGQKKKKNRTKKKKGQESKVPLRERQQAAKARGPPFFQPPPASPPPRSPHATRASCVCLTGPRWGLCFADTWQRWRRQTGEYFREQPNKETAVAVELAELLSHPVSQLNHREKSKKCVVSVDRQIPCCCCCGLSS